MTIIDSYEALDMSSKRKYSRVLKLDEVELLFAKSKAYLHPTTSKKDNVPGYLTLSRGNNATNLDILLSFTPENQLSREELTIYEEADIGDLNLDLEALRIGGNNNSNSRKISEERIVRKPTGSTVMGYSFSVALSFVYSIQIRKPSTGFWFGSIVINTKDGEKLPIVFFHDNESASTLGNQKARNQRFDPFGELGELYWGGVDFIQALEKFVNIEKSTIEPSVYLVNPDTTDLRNFAPFIEKKKTTVEEPYKLPDVKIPDFNKMFATAKWKVLETVATFSARTKNQVLDVIEDHAPPTVKLMIQSPEVTKLGDEFDSARVYLAKWAQQVKEEAELSQSKNMLNDDVYAKINRELGSKELLTDEEVNKASRRKAISQTEWDSFFDYSGRFIVTVDEVKNRIFHGGLEDSVRGHAWLYLLGVYPWDSSNEDRVALRSSYETSYDELKLKWMDDEDKRSEEFWKDQKHRIEKDISRTDRNLAIFSNQKKKVSISSISSNEPPTIRESSPETPDEDDEFDSSNIRNPHLFKMREILLTYNEYNVNLGYVQGMTDLLSPLYVRFQDESLTFWAFTKYMERMEGNFVRDQSGMKRQMTTLNKLLQFMLPDLYKHLEKCESNDLFFFFRMLLVWYKRELEWNQVNCLWEVLWTDYYSSQYYLFIALAILSDNERIIIQNLRRFDEVLKYMNDLSMKINLNSILIRSELLFMKFKRMVDIIDRENTLKKLNNVYDDPNIIEVDPDLRLLLSKEIIIQKEVERPEGVGGG